MNHSTFSKSLLGAFVCLSFTQCSLPSDGIEHENVGGLGLELELSPGVNVDSVQFEITGNGIFPIQGSIPVADPGATISAIIGGIPAGAGYAIRISAVSTDEITTCVGTAPFAVIANQTTAVLVDLICRGPGTSGGVGVVPVVDDCPVINFLSVSPLVAGVGGRIHVAVAATDPDGDALAVSWTASPASIGILTSPGSSSTVFTCAQDGAVELTVSVNDGLCSDEARTSVECRTVSNPSDDG